MTTVDAVVGAVVVVVVVGVNVLSSIGQMLFGRSTQINHTRQVGDGDTGFDKTIGSCGNKELSFGFGRLLSQCQEAVFKVHSGCECCQLQLEMASVVVAIVAVVVANNVVHSSGSGSGSRSSIVVAVDEEC